MYAFVCGLFKAVFCNIQGSLQFVMRLVGKEPHARFGHAITTLGDINGDGLKGLYLNILSKGKLSLLKWKFTVALLHGCFLINNTEWINLFLI